MISAPPALPDWSLHQQISRPIHLPADPCRAADIGRQFIEEDL